MAMSLVFFVCFYLLLGCDFGIYVVSVWGLCWLGCSQRLYYVHDFNLVSYIYVCWSVSLANGILAGRFLLQVSFLFSKHCLNAYVFERARCSMVVCTIRFWGM